MVVKTLLDALLKAEELEVQGKNFYLEAAERALVPSVKDYLNI